MKRELKIYVIGTILGLILAAIKFIFNIDIKVLIYSYLIIGLAVVLGAMLFNILYNLSYQRKMNRISTLLYEKKTEEYIDEVEKLLKTAKGEKLRNNLKLNLAVGYIESKQYDTAIHMLEDLSGKCFMGPAANIVYHLDLFMSYYYAAQYEKAIELYNTKQEIFGQYRNDKSYGGGIAIADIFVAINNKQYEQAEKLLEMAQKSWNNPNLQDVFQELSVTLRERNK